MDSEVEGICVEGYSARFAAAVAKVLATEGGFVDDPADKGGATKYGISLRFLAAEGAFDEDGDGRKDFDLDFDGDIDGRDIRLLTLGDARFAYLKHFWRPIEAEKLPVPIGEMLFDQAVNAGAAAAKKMLQRAINYCHVSLGSKPILRVDGVIDRVTLSALDAIIADPRAGLRSVVEAYRHQVELRYRAIAARFPSQARFLRGWLRRAKELGQ